VNRVLAFATVLLALAWFTGGIGWPVAALAVIVTIYLAE
jgi:hypothetical protein